MTDKAINESTETLRQQAEQVEAINDGRSETAPQVPIVARVVRRYRARMFQAYVIAAMLGFAVLLFLARKVAYFDFDLKLARWIQGMHTFGLDVLMNSVSALGFSPLAGWFVVFTILLCFLLGLRWEAIVLMLTSIVVGLLDAGVKALAGRHRPTSDLVNIFALVDGFSFPSGHVLMFTVYLGFLLFLIYTLTPRSWKRTLGLIVLSLLIALVGVSRVYLGHHWPSDVLGAYLLGSLWLAVTIYLYRKGKTRFFTQQPLAPEKPTQP